MTVAVLRCCTVLLSSYGDQTKVGLTGGGANGTRTRNPLLAKSVNWHRCGLSARGPKRLDSLKHDDRRGGCCSLLLQLIKTTAALPAGWGRLALSGSSGRSRTYLIGIVRRTA
jgi:hypothetical protein